MHFGGAVVLRVHGFLRPILAGWQAERIVSYLCDRWRDLFSFYGVQKDVHCSDCTNVLSTVAHMGHYFLSHHLWSAELGV